MSFSRPRATPYRHVTRYIGSDKAIADLPFLNGNVSLIFCVHTRSHCIPLVGKRRCSHVLVLAERVPQHALLSP